MNNTDFKMLEAPKSFVRCESYYIGICKVDNFQTCQDCKKATLPKA